MHFTYVEGDTVALLRGSQSNLIDQVRYYAAGPSHATPFEVFAMLNPLLGWRIFHREDFIARCEKFAATGDESFESFEAIFGSSRDDVAQVVSLEQTPPDGNVPTNIIVFDGDRVAGVWIGTPRSFVNRVSTKADEDGRHFTDLHYSELWDEGLESMVRPGFAIEAPAIVPAADSVFIRTPHLDADEEICPPTGKTFDVDVYCDTSPPKEGEVSDTIAIVAPPTQDEFEIEAFLSPGVGLSVIGPTSQRFTARRSKDESEHARFQIVVKEPPGTGHVDINAYFFYEGRPCGRVTRSLPASSASGASSTFNGRIKVAAGMEPADLIISVTKQSGSEGCYQVKLTSPHLDADAIGEAGIWDMDSDARDYVKSIFDAFIQTPKADGNRLATLIGAGRKLFDATPDNFKKVYERLAQANVLDTMLIVSDDPYVPWELMVPRGSKEDVAAGKTRDPIGVTHAIGRWITDEHFSPAQRLEFKSPLVVAPDYTGTGIKPLACSPAESAYLQGRFNAQTSVPATYAQVRNALSQSEPDLFHFIGHGSSSLTNILKQQQLLLENNDVITPLNLDGETGIAAAFARRTPFVFLNACEVGQQTLAFGGTMGFVTTFIRLYARGVIAPLWSVSDSVAHNVAQMMYDGAVPHGQEAVPVAEILRQIRAHAYQGATAGVDSYVAYCFHGDPKFVMSCPTNKPAPVAAANPSGQTAQPVQPVP
ncbi:CHAT domain-containing protein [Caballeronia sordidicola]|uniref:TPR protein n=1 Tax=Caballeronia sordidicola TaxID=196367 RepID=A0A226WS20_CABSO|nr:CHAT domain-containing protein [Caballeronia sordidicola]OXC73408.1 TPR protein [Caballeronia sordidicola]